VEVSVDRDVEVPFAEVHDRVMKLVRIALREAPPMDGITVKGVLVKPDRR
jgi:hypothetical protein